MIVQVWEGLDLFFFAPIMISMAAHVLCYFSINTCCAETIVLIFQNILKNKSQLWVIKKIFLVVVIAVSK